MADARLIASSSVCMLALCAVGLFGPPGSALALLILPLPALVAGGIGGTTRAAAATVGAVGVMGGLLGATVAVGFLALAGAASVVASLLLRRAWRLEAVVAIAAAATIVRRPRARDVARTEPGGVAGRRLESVALELRYVSADLSRLRHVHAGRSRISTPRASRSPSGSALILPAMILLATTAVWLANLGLSRRWVWWPQLMTLSRWRTADWAIWLLIGSGFALFLPTRLLGWVAINVFIVCLACYFAQGLAIVSYFLPARRLPRPLRAATYRGHRPPAASPLPSWWCFGVFDLWGTSQLRPRDRPMQRRAATRTDERNSRWK